MTDWIGSNRQAILGVSQANLAWVQHSPSWSFSSLRPNLTLSFAPTLGGPAPYSLIITPFIQGSPSWATAIRKGPSPAEGLAVWAGASRTPAQHPANQPLRTRHSNVFMCTTTKSSLHGRSNLLKISPSCESSAFFGAKSGFKLHIKRYSKIHQSQTSHPPENRNRSQPHSLAITSYIISLRAAPFHCALVNSFMGHRSKVQRQEEGSREKIYLNPPQLL